MKKNQMHVKVYMEFVNTWGDVTESVLIAQFYNMDWAENFIKEAKETEDSNTRIRVETI